MPSRTPEEWMRVYEKTENIHTDGKTNGCYLVDEHGFRNFAESVRKEFAEECINRIVMMQQFLGDKIITNPTTKHKEFIYGLDAAKAAIEELRDAKTNA